MRRPWWLLVPGAATFLACARCASSDPQTPLPDAGAEASVIADASPEVRKTDAPFEPPDAGEGWKWFAAFEPSCTKYSVPIDPQRELPPLEWVPCEGTPPFASGTSGCVEWDWTKLGVAKRNDLAVASVSGDGKFLRIARLRAAPAPMFDEEADLYDRMTGAPLAAWRFRNPQGGQSGQYNDCFVNPVVATRGAPYLHVPTPKFASSIRGDVQQLMNATSYDRPVPDILPYPDVANSLSASEKTEAFIPAFGGRLIRIKRSDMTWVRAASSNLRKPLVIEDDVFARDQTVGWYRLARVEADGAVTQVRAVPSHHLTSLAYDGSYVYWLDVSGGPSPEAGQPQTHMELWRTPYTRDVTAFNANAERLVMLDGSFLHGQNEALVYDGVYATGAVQNVFVVRISDKNAKILPALGTNELIPFYVDQNELWLKYLVSGKPADAHYAKVGIVW
ncbi:MAG: hypothetical protein U0174_00705 [Polyangiaceae bacterium]